MGLLNLPIPEFFIKMPLRSLRFGIDMKRDPVYKKTVDSYTKGAAAWFCKKDYKQGEAGIKKLLKTSMKVSEGQNGANTVSLILEYDLLFDYPGLTQEKKQRIQEKFKHYLKQTLKLLNEDSVSLWHGRFQLACSAWLTASVIDVKSEADFKLISKAQAHFIDAIDAIRITEGWPEGYNYWINNRAYPFALACLSHMNAVEAPFLNEKIKVALETAGMWTLYGTRPDGKFALFGDTGPRNDLKDETQRFIDLVLLGTRNQIFKYYSAYLSTLHKEAAYYHAYRWGIPIFRGLPQLDFSKRLSINDLSFVDGFFKNNRLFGQDAFNQVFIRSGWSRDATFISFRAGDSFAHHGHYHAGHFTLFKHSSLGLTSGSYGKYTAPHRLNYYIRTIAANSILIQQPGEIIQPNQFFKDNVSAGGQKIIIPTGSAITSVSNWKKNKKNVYQGGTITAFDNEDPAYVYINSDLTKAYSDKKAVKVTRELCYLNNEDLLIIHDFVESVKKEYTKKWLFHTWEKPVTQTENLLLGEASNGILNSSDADISISHKDGSAKLTVLLPKNPLIHKIGGKDYRYYVETDGDDTILNGVNMSEGANERPWYDAGLWRIEIMDPQKNKSNEFLVVIKPGKSNNPPHTDYKPVYSSSLAGIVTPRNVILFSKQGSSKLKATTPAGKPHIILGLPENKTASITIARTTIKKETNRHGILKIDSISGKGLNNIEIRI